MDTQDWTVSLAFGLPFWLSVIDSTGWTWTNGPLHAGGDGSTTCLLDSPVSDDKGFSTGGAIGVAFGSLFFGLLVGLVGAFFFFRRREQRYGTGAVALRRKSLEPLDPSMHGLTHPSSSASSTFPSRGGPHDIEPFILPPTPGLDDFSPNSTTGLFPHRRSAQATTSSLGSDRNDPSSPRHEHSSSLGTLGGQQSPTTTVTSSVRSPVAPSPSGQQVYVVHHDAGRPPPVTVFTSDGTQVVELPPQYESAAQSSNPPGPGRAPQALPPPPDGQRRQPRPLVAKQGRMPSNSDPSPSRS
ncbi:hypothetical protein BD311DRAFT_194099 [Dichomitus squalens]|uniref:Transmembrane protein n=1 Tax=Dichomitus squalens TaxID=114155 RepID=A0A4Q9N7I3_9APHY|nr:hypothetical protein BD311DRAFT_194099 [Dichomitus squalens]